MTTLFDVALLSSPNLPAHLMLRPLQSSDYDIGYDTILEPLATGQPPLPSRVFQDVFKTMVESIPALYYVVVIVDRSNVDKERIVATATLLIERKFLRGGATAGHIEDVVVAPSQQGQGLGRVLIDALTQLAHNLSCYKVILDCDEKNVKFYEKCGYEAKGVEMKKYM